MERGGGWVDDGWRGGGYEGGKAAATVHTQPQKQRRHRPIVSLAKQYGGTVAARHLIVFSLPLPSTPISLPPPFASCLLNHCSLLAPKLSEMIIRQ